MVMGGGKVCFGHWGAFYASNPGNSRFAATSSDSTRYGATFDASKVARAGSTTRNKSKGVNFIIKA